MKLVVQLMKKPCNFVNHFLGKTLKKTIKKLCIWVRKSLKWLNKLLLSYNGVLIFDKNYKDSKNPYKDECILGLHGFYFESN